MASRLETRLLARRRLAGAGGDRGWSRWRPGRARATSSSASRSRAAPRTAELPAIARVAGALDWTALLRPVEPATRPAATLPPSAALLVVDAGDGALVASAGAPLAGLSRSRHRSRATRWRSGSRAQTGGRLEQGWRSASCSVRLLLRLADGRAARLYVVPLPDRRAPGGAEAAFFGALDRRLLVAAAIVGLLALGADVGRRPRRHAAGRGAAGGDPRAARAGACARRVDAGGSREDDASSARRSTRWPPSSSGRSAAAAIWSTTSRTSCGRR